MSRADADTWLDEQLSQFDLRGRNWRYSHLITQDIPYLFSLVLNGNGIVAAEIEWLIKKRGFNEAEAGTVRKVVSLLNDNATLIRELAGSRRR